jgi:ubiquinone/menaquinone biosynthesis C-methylase UbiE
VDSYEHLYKAKLVKTARMVGLDDFVIDLVPILRERKNERILDVGCGAGRNAVFLADEGFHVVGLDISSTALGLALEEADKADLKNCVFVRHDFLKLPFPDSQFDTVISCYSVENQPLPKIRKALNEMKRVLIDRGLVLVTLHSTKHWRFGLGKEISPGTFLTTETIKGKKLRFAAHFFEKDDAEKLFHSIELNIMSLKERVKVTDRKRAHWIIIGEKSS